MQKIVQSANLNKQAIAKAIKEYDGYSTLKEREKLFPLIAAFSRRYSRSKKALISLLKKMLP